MVIVKKSTCKPMVLKHAVFTSIAPNENGKFPLLRLVKDFWFPTPTVGILKTRVGRGGGYSQLQHGIARWVRPLEELRFLLGARDFLTCQEVAFTTYGRPLTTLLRCVHCVCFVHITYDIPSNNLNAHYIDLDFCALYREKLLTNLLNSAYILLCCYTGLRLDNR